MRDDLVLPSTARRLQREGVTWIPAPGDWCVVLGAEYVSEAQAGVWVVVAVSPDHTSVTLADSQSQWPVTHVNAQVCVWLPSAGQLKTWLRGRGYRVNTGEAQGALLGQMSMTAYHVCRLIKPGEPPIDGEGVNEAEAVAFAILQILGAHTSRSEGSQRPG